MEATYTISAMPSLFPDGEYKGKLRSVIFKAVAENDTREWFAKNCGQFEGAFGKIMPGNLAKVIVAALLHGDPVELPGLYREHQFEQGFLFEWSPVYLVLPPIFFSQKQLV